MKSKYSHAERVRAVKHYIFSDRFISISDMRINYPSFHRWLSESVLQSVSEESGYSVEKLQQKIKEKIADGVRRAKELHRQLNYQLYSHHKG